MHNFSVQQFKAWLCAVLISFLKLVAGTLVVAVLFFQFMLIGPILEGKLFPVVTDISYKVVLSTPEKLVISVTGEKKRGHCKFDSVTALVNTKDGYVKGTVTFAEDNDGAPSSRPAGYQSFGNWEIKPNGKDIIFSVEHECHVMWHTVTPMFTVVPTSGNNIRFLQ